MFYKSYKKILTSYPLNFKNIGVSYPLLPILFDFCIHNYWQSHSSFSCYFSIRMYTFNRQLRDIIHMNNNIVLDDVIKKMMSEKINKYEQKNFEKNNKLDTWIPGTRKKDLQISRNIEDFINESKPSKWRSQIDRRCGALGIKVGMIPLWDTFGTRYPCTVIYLDHNVVMDIRTNDKDGYVAVEIGAGRRKIKNVTRPLLGHYSRCHVDLYPPHLVREFRVSKELYLPSPGTIIPARHFVPGQAVDISGLNKGKGFQGGMKRHGFRGMPASHGVSKSHRSIGSTGQCQDPGRVFKGKKMPGRMGATRKTVQNLRVIMVDRGRNLVYVNGGIPGQKGSFVEIRDAIKRPLFGSKQLCATNHGGKNKDSCNIEQHRFPPLPTWKIEENIDGCGTGGYEEYIPIMN